jgi:putative ABC transport system permease protein
MLKNYIKIAWRNLARHKGFTLINVLGLAIGLTGCILIGLFVWDEWKFDTFIKDHDRVYRMYDRRTDEQGVTSHAGTPPMFAHVLKTEFPEVENAARMMDIQTKQLFEFGTKKTYEENGFLAEAAIFEVMPLPFREGNPSTALLEPNTVVLSDELATKFFGNDNALGKTILIGRDNYKITGVMATRSPHFHLALNYVASFASAGIPEQRMQSWSWQQLRTYVKLKPNSDVNKLQDKFQEVVKQRAHPLTKENNFSYLPYFQPLAKIHLHSADFEFDTALRGNASYVKGLTIIAIFVLIIACFNFINLATARSLKRAREVGVRKAIGAERGQLMTQFTGETVLLSLIAVAVSACAAMLLLPSLNAFTGKQMAFNPTANPILLLVLLGLGIVVGILAGIYPAIFLSGFRPVKVLKGLNAGTGNISWLRRGLIVVQFALSALLIICTIIVSKQVDFLHHKDLGFNKEQLMFFPLRGENIQQNHEAFRNQLLTSKDITSVSIGYGFPGDAVAGDDVIVPTADGPKSTGATQLMVDYDYVNTMDLKVIAGRAFSRDFSTDKDQAFMINETAVKQLGFGTPENAIGKQLMWNVWGPPGRDSLKTGLIIGVVKDFHYKSLYVQIETTVLQIFPEAYSKVAVKLKSHQAEDAIAHVKKTWAAFSPEYPLDYNFLDDNFEVMYKTEDKLNSLLWIFTIMAIVVGCMGLFGLTAFAAEQRVKEIGIRKVLGATIGNITALLSRDFVKLVVIASLVAFPIAWLAMNKWLEGFVYRINISWWIFPVAGIIAVVVALITVSIQAVKAGMANPVKSLRSE